jgi:Tfp pilus assembly protein PilF
LQLAQSAQTQLPNTPEINDTIGWIYLKKGLPELAARQFKASTEKDATNQAFWAHLGLAYAKTGDLAKAKEILERTLQHDPNVHSAEEARAVLRQLGSKG